MKSFFLFIELSGLQQFLAVKDPAVSEFINDSRRIVSNVKKAEMEIQASFLIFRIETELSASQAVIEAAVKVLDNLIQHSEDLHEFSMMLIYRDSADIENISGEIRQDYYTQCIDAAILVEKQISEASCMDNTGEVLPGFIVLNAEEAKPPVSISLYNEKLADKDEIVRLIETIVPECGKERTVSRLLLRGNSDIVLHCNLDAVLYKIGIEKDSDPIIINPFEGDAGTIMPFYRSIDPGFIRNSSQYLSGIELKSWNNRTESLMNVNSDYPEESFFITYCLYIKARIRAFESEQVPPVIIFEGVEAATPAMLDYFNRVLDYISSEFEPVIIFFENKAFRIKNTIIEHEVLSGTEVYDCCSAIRLPERGSKLKYVMKRLLFAVHLVEGLFDSKLMNEFLTGFGYDEAEIKNGLNQLEAAGCLRKGRFPHVLRGRGSREIIKDVTAGDDIYIAVASFINKNIYKINNLDFGLAAERLLPAIVNDEVNSAVYGCLTRVLDHGGTNFVRNCLKRCGDMPEQLLTALKLRCALIEGGRDECIELLKNIPEKPESPDNWQAAAVMMETSRYFHALNDFPRALDYVKKVLIYLQDENSPRQEGAAFIELGFIMMCKGKLLESSEYMSLAVEKLLTSGDHYNLMKAYIFSAIGQYLWGSLDTALDFTEKAIAEASENNYENWYFFTEFFRCRLFFELGRYYDAEKLLSGCLLRNEIYRDEKRRKLFLAWTARACVYQGKVYRGLNMLKSLEDNPEVLMFTGEAYFLHGDLEKAVSNIEAAGSMDGYFSKEFNPLEHISWGNGFVSVEDRALRSVQGTGVMLHLVKAMHAYFIGLSGDKEYGIELLFALTRDQKLSEYDPFNRLYFYFYCILYDKGSKDDIVDKLTLISKALKYLQQTSSRISSPSVRQEFMMKNYWNSRLVNEAQREKLI